MNTYFIIGIGLLITGLVVHWAVWRFLIKPKLAQLQQSQQAKTDE